MKTGTLLAIILLTLIALAHVLRLTFTTEVIVAGTPVPQWVSAVAVVVPAVIAWLLWRESK
jgi:uncharacterized membrane protein